MYETEENQEELGGQMSFLEHLDELRGRLVRSVVFILVAFIGCWFVSNQIFSFLAEPVEKALAEAQRRDVPIEGRTGSERVLSLRELKIGDEGRYIFDKATTIGTTVVSPGSSVGAVVEADQVGKPALYTTEKLLTSSGVVPEGIKLPVDLTFKDGENPNVNERLIVTTVPEQFTLLVTVSLYSAIAVSVPFLLLQIWGFISPALYKHERKYVTPFVLLSTSSFVLGAAFAYYILFPPAARYLLSLGPDFQLLIRATDYFEFITLIMLAMGIVFQMPAVTYVLARIGIVSAGFLIRIWKIALVVMLIVAAFISPTGDIPNMMLFATPMMALYVVSILIAWIFGTKRETDE
ncbi:MAG: twin-arginine translocase subunit TatC [Acidobacteria bacterium]|nr:MAG: twin-arginine translocase subunit TatC [Acidobacteriota bacterium]REJ98394.1 MAG: twin-arginine translocase subunit TatC [Acidobacteriota bacterium]REK17138.1 MAG: twin-arginine translocase subunit TatC [Acidobacteriota bacterium]REK43048.1 MAG: twin-arginine translocase subunit TatC [Acidobacteriota bacterium]